jgi:uncharacterized membrane protein YoaK (UPF0700 family)
MSSSVSLDVVVSPPLRWEETLQMALLLAFSGGYLDAYTWIIHGVMANAQTANLVLLWVHGIGGHWEEALHFVPPMLAFTAGIVTASLLRHTTGNRTCVITTLIEIALLIVVGILHNRLPDVAGTLGISFVAAMQAAIFTKVEGSVYSSVMITGNLRQAIEALFGAISGQPGTLRRSGIFAGLCFAFSVGAAVGALVTNSVPALTLGIPVVALLIVLLHCETQRDTG